MKEVWILTQAFNCRQGIFSTYKKALKRLKQLKKIKELPQEEDFPEFYRSVWLDSEGGVWEIQKEVVR